MSISIILIGLLIPLTLLAIAVVKSSEVWRGRLATLPRWQQVCTVLGVGLAVMFGGEKEPPVVVPTEIMEILTLRPDGSLTDLSGKVASGVQAQAISDYITASASLVTNANAIVEQARLDCIALTNTLLQADYDIAYIALDLPRGTPTATNHNISITFQRVEQTTTNLDALVWFSSLPTTNVDVYVSIQSQRILGRRSVQLPTTGLQPRSLMALSASATATPYPLALQAPRLNQTMIFHSAATRLGNI